MINEINLQFRSFKHSVFLLKNILVTRSVSRIDCENNTPILSSKIEVVFSIDVAETILNISIVFEFAE